MVTTATTAKILDFMRRNQMRGEGGEALWTAPTKGEEIAE